MKCAIEAGYRHIDCAAAYCNEEEIGSALKEKLGEACERGELFVTSKLWNTFHHPDDVRPACLKTLKDLGLSYLDLYLIHWPTAFERGGELFPKNPDSKMRYADTPFTDTWKEMEKLVEEGLCRHIGLSNFNSKQIDKVLAIASIKPAVLQVEVHPYLTQKPLIQHCQEHGIAVTAYSPLGSPDRPWAKPGDPSLLEDPKVIEIAQKYGKSAAQVLIRFSVDRGIVVIPKSANPKRIKENFDVFDFQLSKEDLEVLESFNRNWRACLPQIQVDGKGVPRDRDHPDFPFDEPY